MAAATQKKKMSKKKKILIIVFSIIAFLLVATICAGLGVLHWYCQTKDYQVVSAADIVDDDTKIIAHRGFSDPASGRSCSFLPSWYIYHQRRYPDRPRKCCHTWHELPVRRIRST